MDVTLLCPQQEYRLDAQFESAATENCRLSGGTFCVSHDIESSYAGADVVYAKSWGALPCYGRPQDEWELRKNYRHFIVDEEKMRLTNTVRGVNSTMKSVPRRRSGKSLWCPWCGAMHAYSANIPCCALIDT
jgi:ornithine carbamoyltransferase